MTIAVTGAGGLLGRAVLRELIDAGQPVRAIDRRLPASSDTDGRVDGRTADLCDHAATRDVLAGCNAVVHLAALPTPTADVPFVVFRDNVTTAASVFFAAAEFGIRRIVTASSQSVLGLPWAPQVVEPAYLPVDEDHPCEPSDAYSASKLAGEQLAAMFCRRGDLDVRCLRFPVIWEARNHAACTRRRIEDPARGAKSLWAYIDARDAARGIRLALEKPLAGFEVLNLTSCRAFASAPVPELVAMWLPGVRDVRVRLEPDTALFDWRRTAARLGFRSRYRWDAAGISDTGG